MNKAKRKKIEGICSLLETINQQILDIETEEQDAFDNLSEGLQATDMGQTMEEAIDLLDSASEYVSQAIDELGGIL